MIVFDSTKCNQNPACGTSDEGPCSNKYDGDHTPVVDGPAVVEPLTDRFQPEFNGKYVFNNMYRVEQSHGAAGWCPPEALQPVK